MRQEVYKAIYDKYLQKYWEIDKDVENDFCRFHDIGANLLVCHILLKPAYKNMKKFSEHINALRDYFKLLEKYPNFKKDELSKLGGHFPEFGDGLEKKIDCDYEAEGFSDYKTYYVAYAKRKLEGEKNNGR